MAQSLVIHNWCDICLNEDKHTPADTYAVNVSVLAPDEKTEAATPARPEDNPAPFVVELCPEHGAPLAEAVLGLVKFGRAPTRAKAPAGRTRSDQLPGSVTCPACQDVRNSVSSLRKHVRDEHGTSLAGVGFYPANQTCPECGDGFPNRQGLAAHVRVAHPNVKQSA